jgi:hypothetical protein
MRQMEATRVMEENIKALDKQIEENKRQIDVVRSNKNKTTISEN